MAVAGEQEVIGGITFRDFAQPGFLEARGFLIPEGTPLREGGPAGQPAVANPRGGVNRKTPDGDCVLRRPQRPPGPRLRQRPDGPPEGPPPPP